MSEVDLVEQAELHTQHVLEVIVVNDVGSQYEYLAGEFDSLWQSW